MLSNKPHIRNLVEICAQKGIQQVVISPGSRNAPLVISFNEHVQFNCLSIPDERVAGFFALGIAQQTRKPVIITCTSGTASLNFAPAIAEAFYQKVPLLVLTADRPVEWIHQGEGQSIAQRNVFANYVKKSYELPQEVTDRDELWSANRIICEAIDKTTEGWGGPVHLNIPFREPLYDKADYSQQSLPKIIESTVFEKKLNDKTLVELAAIWQSTPKKMILCGALPITDKSESQLLTSLLATLNQDSSLVVFSEITSNLKNPTFFGSFDSLLSTVEQSESEDFAPDLLVTIGGSFISKRIKLWLRQFSPKAHWHVENIDYHVDTFQALTKTINISPVTFFQQLVTKIQNTKKNILKIGEQKSYQQLWINRAKNVRKAHEKFLKKVAWSDIKVFDMLLPNLPEKTNLHLANSTPIRYAQLFPYRSDIRYNANRGVAGIDGSTSTAAGAAHITQLPTTIITGDISFFYDSNAFWHHHLSEHLRIVLINNSGGNIFRFIKGPDTTDQLSDYFEAHHQRSAEYVAKTFNLNYFVATNEESLAQLLPTYFAPTANQRPSILEIQTPRMDNASIWRQYYQYLKKTPKRKTWSKTGKIKQ
ncbi:MAG: 2-succinyl-5-enolpyruvyl-6-hydroxy-3-cyclohexene-1-carboxylic-acid synthase [Bacteroidota bacterium]